MSFRSKRYKSIKELIEVTKSYNIKEAINLIKKVKQLKFDEIGRLHYCRKVSNK